LGDDSHDLLAPKHRIQRSRGHGLLDLVDLSVGSRVELIEVLPQPGQETANLVGHPRHIEVPIGLLCASGCGSVARIAEAGDRVAGLLAGDL
jgi:hypothetical protein